MVGRCGHVIDGVSYIVMRRLSIANQTHVTVNGLEFAVAGVDIALQRTLIRNSRLLRIRKLTMAAGTKSARRQEIP